MDNKIIFNIIKHGWGENWAAHPFAVVHDTGVIILDAVRVHICRLELHELAADVGVVDDVVVVDDDVIVAIWSILFVNQAYHVTQLMYDYAFLYIE